MKDLVSVVIPTYNREKTISRAIKSALCQTYKSIEIIVVDDCSNDNTERIVINEFAHDPRVTFHKLEKNQGACVARNVGVQISKGKFVAFLDSDDEFLPDKIAKQIEFIKKYNVSLCATDFTIIDNHGTETLVKTHPGTSKEVYNDLLYCNFITTGTLIGYRECFIEVQFDESLPRYQDWDLVLRLCKKYSFHFIQDSLLLQYTQAQSITKTTNHKKTLKALVTIYEKNREGFRTCRKAYGQINWLIGLHELFLDKTNPYRHMIIGAIYGRFKLKRFMIIILSLFNKSIIDRQI